MSQHRPLKSGDHVYLIDGSGYIFRAYHALPPLTRKSDGLPVGAVQGFCNMLWKLLKDMKAGEKPTHLAVIFDKSEQTFRKRIYPDYKAHRPDPPADLIPQFGLIRQATRAFNVACVEQDDFEADDLIATYARQAAEIGATVRIVSSDKDLMSSMRSGPATASKPSGNSSAISRAPTALNVARKPASLTISKLRAASPAKLPGSSSARRAGISDCRAAGPWTARSSDI